MHSYCRGVRVRTCTRGALTCVPVQNGLDGVFVLTSAIGWLDRCTCSAKRHTSINQVKHHTYINTYRHVCTEKQLAQENKHVDRHYSSPAQARHVLHFALVKRIRRPTLRYKHLCAATNKNNPLPKHWQDPINTHALYMYIIYSIHPGNQCRFGFTWLCAIESPTSQSA